MAATKAAVLGLLGDAYRRRGTVGLITFRGDGAEVVLRPTGSVEIARARLADLETGGRTPLAAGLDEARRVVNGLTDRGDVECTVVLVTDGRATAGEPDPVTAARTSFAALARTGARVVVLDTETGPSRLSLAAELAAAAEVEYRHLDASITDLETTVREL
jgi:magnesium chelatase subunit D